jgi:hypothetical protein
LATVKDIEADITLEIDGRDVTPDRFLKGVRSFFELLREVTRKVGGKRTAVNWNVQVRQGSNLVGVVPRPGYDPVMIALITDAMGTGISQIEDHGIEPQYFSEGALRSVRDLGTLIRKPERDDLKVRVWVKKNPLPVTAKAAAHVNELLMSEHEDHGSVEGKLQTVTERGGLQFVVYEPIWDKGIKCFIPEDMVDTAMKYFKVRVEVYGLVKYRKDGRPLSIVAESIEPLNQGRSIPSIREMRGILRSM